MRIWSVSGETLSGAVAVAPAPGAVGLDALVRLHLDDEHTVTRRDDDEVGLALHLADVMRDLERVEDDPIV